MTAILLRQDAISEFSYDRTSSRYRVVEGAGRGRFIGKDAFLYQLDRTLDQRKQQLIDLADRLSVDGDLRSFQQNAANLLRDIHIGFAIKAANGIENLTAKDYKAIESTLRQQLYTGKDEVTGDRYGLKYLAQDMRSGVSVAMLRSRLGLFSESGKVTYWQIWAEKQPEPYAIRVLGATDRHCPECVAYAALPPMRMDAIVKPGMACSCRNRCLCRLEPMDLDRALQLGMKDPRPSAQRQRELEKVLSKGFGKRKR